MSSSYDKKSIIDKTHGAGGNETAGLIEDIFRKAFSNKYLDELTDSAVVPGSERIALTTDSFVVRPVFFPGGDIGRLAVCGTVNDILMSGARPAYLTAGFILEEGMPIGDLEQIVRSMAETAKEAEVEIVTGDTKVIEAADPKAPGLMINTAGVGIINGETKISPSRICPGDAVILSGNLGDHHAAILSSRMSIKNSIVSDAAPLTEMITGLTGSGIDVHAMRDVTRGGLATVLNEFASASDLHIRLYESDIPITREVDGFCRILGLDPLYMGNEGKCVIVLPEEEADEALNIIKKGKYGKNAALIGRVDNSAEGVTMVTSIGGEKVINILHGEGLPRIC